jgi:UPF0755 protein
MSEPISASLRAVQRIGAEAFAGTTLASDVGPTVRRVARRRVGRAVGAGVAAVALVAAVAVGAVAIGHGGASLAPAGPSLTSSAGVDAELAGVVVQAGDTGADIGRTLQGAGVIESVTDFVNVANAHPDLAYRIAPGYYVLPKGITSLAAIEALLDPASRQGPNVTFPEGLTKEQTLARIHDELAIPMAELEAAAANPDSIGLPAEAGGDVEGWLGPYIYYFDPGESATAELSFMVAATVRNLDAEGVAPTDRERVLTVASLIEREAKLDVDRPKIARVIQNRLDAGMALELESTLQYIIWAEDAAYPNDAIRPADSSYNTFVVTGLPPGPIGSPGVASINAALHPADGAWLYFVTVNLETGETLYATTLEEHEQNVELLHEWLAANPAWTTGHPMDASG